MVKYVYVVVIIWLIWLLCGERLINVHVPVYVYIVSCPASYLHPERKKAGHETNVCVHVCNQNFC